MGSRCIKPLTHQKNQIMNRIAVCGYPGKVWFDTFAEIVAELTSEKNSFKMYGTGSVGNYLYVYIGGIIQYNVMFRDYLRTNGPDALIELLCEMARPSGTRLKPSQV